MKSVTILSGLHHTVAISENEDIYVTGSNIPGQLGLGEYGVTSKNENEFGLIDFCDEWRQPYSCQL